MKQTGWTGPTRLDLMRRVMASPPPRTPPFLEWFLHAITFLALVAGIGFVALVLLNVIG